MILQQLPQTIEQKVQALQSQLEEKGYEVGRGYCKLFTIEDCKYSIAALGQCFGNNPAAPYILLSVPLWEDEFVDAHMKGVFGPMPRDTWGSHRFDEREALLVVGLLPPPARYFGMQTYLFTREGALNQEDPIFRSVTDPTWRKIIFGAPPNPSRVFTFASLGKTNNNVSIERQSGAAFGQERSFIITPDARMAREMTDVLLQTGVADRKDVFTEPVSPEIARIGLGREADDFLTLIRYAEPENKEAAEQWRHELPLAVLRVRDHSATTATPEPWPKPAYEVKTARSELDLKGDLGALVQGIKHQWGQNDAQVGEFQSLQLSVDLIGQHCLTRPMNCLGDNPDADYQISPSLTFDNGEVIAVVGTLGTATGNAAYVGLSVNRLAILQGIANISDVDLQGTASAFAPTIANTDKFYIYYFSRDCRGLPPNSLPMTEEMVPRGDVIKIIQRNYIVPGTVTGPDPKQLLNPVAIFLNGNARPKKL